MLWGIFALSPGKIEGEALSGASFVLDALGRPVVSSVLLGSPASLAGLSVGDVVLTANGLSGQGLGRGLNPSIETDLTSGNSVLLEVMKETGYRSVVWIKIPRLTVGQRRFMASYSDLSFIWDGVKLSWSGALEFYRLFLEGNLSLDALSSHMEDFSEELHRFKNYLGSYGTSGLSGDGWNQLRKAQESMISALYLMDQERQRMSSGGTWKVNVNGIEKRISSVEKYLIFSLNLAGVTGIEDKN